MLKVLVLMKMKLILLLAILPIIVVKSELVTDDVDKRNFVSNLHARAQNPQTTKGTFTVVTPYSIRPGKPFNVAVRGFQVSSSIKLSVKISGVTSSGSNLKIQKTTEISSFKPKAFLQFKTTAIPPGAYKFSVVSDGYSDEKELSYITNEYSFFIMTDKAVYFPDDAIKFRIFAINSETKSVNPKRKTDVFIKDAGGTIITKFSDVKFLKGKFQSEWQLSSGPSMGYWQIEVISGNDISSKKIEVADFAVPLVYASITVPTSIPLASGKVTVTLNVKYSFNDEVDGKATVIFEAFGTEYLRKEIDVDKPVINFDVDFTEEMIRMGQIFVTAYAIRLEFFDYMKGITVSDSATLQILTHSYAIYLTADQFARPGRNFRYSIVVKKYDGTPAPAGKKVTSTISTSTMFNRTELLLDANGFVESSFFIPSNEVFTLPPSSYITVDSEDTTVVQRVLLPLIANGSPSDLSTNTMILDVITRSPSINSPVQVEVIISELTEQAICLITAKGVLLESIDVPIIGLTNSPYYGGTFSFNPKLTYAPMVKIICYYVRQDEMTVTATTSVEFAYDLTNYVSLSFAKPQVKPEENIEVNVESYLDSTVSLVAVDQKLLLQGDGHCFTKSDVFSDLNKYFETVPYGKGKITEYEYNFNNQGLLIFTNIPIKPEWLLSEIEPRTDNQYDVLTDENGRNYKRYRAPKKYGNSILWRNIDIRTPSPNDSTKRKGREKITQVAPKNQANYVVCGISVSPVNGIGIFSAKSSIDVFMPFFISAEFPDSIKRTEILVQAITIYNFLTQEQPFEVTINKDPKYQIVTSSSFGWIDTGTVYKRSLNTKIGVHSRIQFTLKALQLGTINFKITARGPLAGDSIDRVLNVVPVGIYRTVTDSVMISVWSGMTVTKKLYCNIPSSSLEVISATALVTGDIMARPIYYLNVKKIIVLPYGCGEQTLITLVPNIVVWIYLTVMDQLSSDLLITLSRNTNYGYQRELTFLRRDGAFSPFGDMTPPSTWLTAYAGWAFYLAKDLISIDMNVLRRGLNYLSSVQNGDGSFREVYPLRSFTRQGYGIAMTAYITIYVGGVLSDFPEYTNMHKKAIGYLETNWCKCLDNQNEYGLALISYALMLANNPKASNVINIFYMMRRETATEIYFSNVETTSYCLLILLKKGDRYQDALKIVNYLIRISNNFGGFSSTQDTVMGIYALSRFAMMYSNNGNINLVLTPNIGPQISTSITKQEAWTLKQFNLNKNIYSLDVSATSTGVALATVSLVCAYHEESSQFEPAFDITYQFTFTCQNQIILKVLVNLILEGESGMAIVMIRLPSGFIYDEVIESPDVQIIEPTDGGATVTLYFEKITSSPVSMQIRALRNSIVNGTQAGHIHVVDYYVPSNEAMGTFMLPELSRSCGLVFRK